LLRSLQLQLLTWLAALAVVGMIVKPTLDTGLFAVAFALGTALLRIREHMKAKDEVPRRESQFGNAIGLKSRRDTRIFGEALGAALAWCAVAARFRFAHVALVPARLDVATLALAAIVPSTMLLFGALTALRARRARTRREADLEQ
jgi:hypothetical protein